VGTGWRVNREGRIHRAGLPGAGWPGSWRAAGRGLELSELGLQPPRLFLQLQDAAHARQVHPSAVRAMICCSRSMSPVL
jgi:hypothetical protein